MNDTTLKTAVAEAKRFLARVKDYKAAQTPEEYSQPRESGALRRASLDLTRALADMRKPS